MDHPSCQELLTIWNLGYIHGSAPRRREILKRCFGLLISFVPWQKQLPLKWCLPYACSISFSRVPRVPISCKRNQHRPSWERFSWLGARAVRGGWAPDIRACSLSTPSCQMQTLHLGKIERFTAKVGNLKTMSFHQMGLGRTSALILLDYPLVHDDSKPSSSFYLNLFGWCCYLLLTHERILADGQDGLKKMAQAQAARSITSPFTRNICQRRAAEVKLVGPGFLIWRAAYLTLRLGKAIGKANHQGVPCQCHANAMPMPCQCQCHAHSHKSRGCGTRCRCRGPQQKPMRWW